MGRRQREADLRWRQPPRLEVHPAGGEPAVYYLVPHLNEPAGGVRVMYRHVDLLNEMGIRAAVLHDAEGFRAGWFVNNTAIVHPSGIRLRENDILVVPECYGPGMPLLPEKVRKLIFNQNAYHTFDLLPVGTDPYGPVPNLLGVMTVSPDNREMLSLVYPKLAVWGTRPVIDAKIFHRGPRPEVRNRGWVADPQTRQAIPHHRPLRRRLAFMPERREAERHQLWHMLSARGVDWEPVPISGKSEAEVGEILRECAIFLSFSEREGFGLPPAEAMACGCYVIGFHGGGGREFFDPAYCSPVDDLTSFARAVLEATSRPLEELQALGAKASEEVLGVYTVDGLRSDLRAVFERFL
jgi:glycosyltransferase involved in cell wall biosynthesis